MPKVQLPFVQVFHVELFAESRNWRAKFFGVWKYEVAEDPDEIIFRNSFYLCWLGDMMSI